MIPRRIALEGFLCYQGEQVIDLDGFDLWVFSGRNGSGKSAVFDAMTFALFGVHRGGARGNENLIHADAPEFALTFDFDLGPERYRVRRSQRRGGRSERQVFRHQQDEGGGDHWFAVPDTSSDAGLKRWVEENVGLDYDVFTSSVLLRQGEAEKLLSASPKVRTEILAQVVDLRRYQHLHDRAEARRRDRKARAENLHAQLAGAPKVEAAEVEAAEARLVAAEAALSAARAGRDRLNEVEVQAGRWLDLNERRGKAVAEAAHADRLIIESAEIARDWARLQELDGVLPALNEAIGRRATIARAEAEAGRREAERKGLGRKLDLMTGLADQGRGRLAEVVAEIARDEARRRAIVERMSGLEAPIQRMRSARALRETTARLEDTLSGFPADLDDEVERLEADRGRRDGWKVALPHLESLASGREALASARSRIEAATGKLAALEVEGKRLKASLGDLVAADESARKVRDESRDRATEARTIARAAEDRLGRFEGLEGSPACDRCGQPLTPEHFAREADRLRAERDDALRRLEAADETSREAQARAVAAEAARAEAERAIQRARDAFKGAQEERRQAEGDAARHAADCAKAYGHLDEPLRMRIAPDLPADWLETTFPEPTDLDEGRRQREGLAAIERRLKETVSRRDAMRTARTRLDEARRSLAAIGLRPDDEAAEAQHTALAAEVAALDRCLAGHERERALAEETNGHLASHIDGVKVRIAEVDRHLATGRAQVEARRDESARARAALPKQWRIAFDEADTLDAWQAERRELRRKGTESRAVELPQAQLMLSRVRAAVADLDARIAAIPEEARRDPKALAAPKAEADARLDAAEKGQRARQRDLDALRRDRQAREALESQAREADGAHALSDTLARLLGRDGLQRDLLRDAERGILDCANPILREVSGGEMELRLAGGGDDDAEPALALEAIIRTHGRSHTVDAAYLSGSQRFRVAVSLALGIGQFARGLHRPIESVIIDEGFGSLDRQGRQEMIEQLNALKGRLARIVLVSHQEEFADAFDDGYRFEVVDGSTIVTPFHR